MLKGKMDYYYGTKVYHFKKGDSIYFDADKPHGPKKNNYWWMSIFNGNLF